jgi:hypothetical protein
MNEFRFGHSLFPVFDSECDRVNRVILFGGIDLRSPSGKDKSNEQVK